jgi:hypothetical protein
MKNLFDITVNELRNIFVKEFTNYKSLFLPEKITNVIDVYDLFKIEYTEKIWAFPGIGVIVFPTFLVEPIKFYTKNENNNENYYVFIKNFMKSENYSKYDFQEVIKHVDPSIIPHINLQLDLSEVKDEDILTDKISKMSVEELRKMYKMILLDWANDDDKVKEIASQVLSKDELEDAPFYDRFIGVIDIVEMLVEKIRKTK